MSKIPFNRLSLWWNHLILPFSFWVYLVGLDQGVAWSSVFFCMLLLTASAFMASFGYIINDYFDRVPDQLTGKKNFFDGDTHIKTLTIGAVIVGGIFLWSLLPLQPFTIALLILEIVLFFLYSAPPIRLKNTNAGIVLDALYSRVVPVLTVLSFGSAIDNKTILISAIWMLIVGLRNILEHQINDHETDRLAGQNTFVRKHEISKAKRWIFRYLLPFEAGLTILTVILLSDTIAGLFWTLPVFLAFYALRFKIWDVATWKSGLLEERTIHLPNNYYADFLPLGALILFLITDHSFLPLIIVHLLIFPYSTQKTLLGIRAILMEIALRIKMAFQYLYHGLKTIVSMAINKPIIWIFMLGGVNLKKQNLSAWGYIKKRFNQL